jgi:hypothetical protein
VPESAVPVDVVGISVHTGNAVPRIPVGRVARERGVSVIYGGVHATLFPGEAFELKAPHTVVEGDGDIAWDKVVSDCSAVKANRSTRVDALRVASSCARFDGRSARETTY